MKTVTSGENYTTVEVDTAEVVKFSFASTSLSVKVIEGEITVALTETAQAGDDGTITVSKGETEMFNHYRMNVDTYYLTGSGKAVLHASNMVEVNPFEGKVKGGDGGGDNTHYKGTTTTPLENGSTTNPIVIDGESYTAVFGDVVVYGYTEFVFDGTQWSEFGRPFDTTPTQGSMNAVTSDGIYNVTPLKRGSGVGSICGLQSQNRASGEHSFAGGIASKATSRSSFAYGYYVTASGGNSAAFGTVSNAPYSNMMVAGAYNNARSGDLFEIGNGSQNAHSNIIEASSRAFNVNGDIEINNIAIPTPYTTMPTITADMLGKIAMYVGATGNGYTQGCFYIAATDGAAEPTYSWVRIGGDNYTNYTTYEQVIGTWIDGSILYQKTYTGISLNNNSWNHGIIDTTGKTVCDIRGYITSEKIGAVDINYYRNGSEFVTTFWNSSALDILPGLSASDFGTLTATITIQYTKSSA